MPDGLYVKNPQNSELGRDLISSAAEMIGSSGIEAFTLLKLARKVGCTEATVYRYFGSKQQLLYYLMNLYWGYVAFSVDYHSQKHKSARKQLREAIEVISNPHIEEFTDSALAASLKSVAIQEGIRIHLTPALSEDLKKGHLAHYVQLISLFETLIREAHPDYEYSRSLAGTLIDASLQQLFHHMHKTPFSDKPCETSGPAGFLKSLLPQEKGAHG